MADQREGGIAWTDQTWNPTRGCSPVSPGCAHCYAETVAARFSGPGKPYEGLVDTDGKWNGTLRLVEDHLEDPLRWGRPRRVFVNSMSDLFHENVPFDYIDKVFAVMALSTRHTFQVLTKRQDRMLEYFRVHRDKPLDQCPEARIGKVAMDLAFSRGEKVEAPNWDVFWQWPIPNVWLGVSVENQTFADTRIPVLKQVPAAVRFLSVEPMLGPIDFTVDTEVGRLCQLTRYEDTPGLDWVIVGGESGRGARPFDLAWATSMVAQCRQAGVPVFMKQIGGKPVATPAQQSWWKGGDDHRSALADTKGGDPAEWPPGLRVREFPKLRGRS